MKYKEVKEYHGSGQLKWQYYEDENGNRCGEFRTYSESGDLEWHCFKRDDVLYSEVKAFYDDGSLWFHHLEDGEGNELATVIEFGNPSTHSEEELIGIAKEHNLPLLSDLPKAEVEVTLWNLKHPDMPCLPIETK